MNIVYINIVEMLREWNFHLEEDSNGSRELVFMLYVYVICVHQLTVLTHYYELSNDSVA